MAPDPFHITETKSIIVVIVVTYGMVTSQSCWYLRSSRRNNMPSQEAKTTKSLSMFFGTDGYEKCAIFTEKLETKKIGRVEKGNIDERGPNQTTGFKCLESLIRARTSWQVREANAQVRGAPRNGSFLYTVAMEWNVMSMMSNQTPLKPVVLCNGYM
ncbi:hypothetical protein B0T20DRAFT_394309 [Sordaria brevicollis]|uniref:Uncharacterized protein n=1 Tax=Sordaria brevicollis TaxID=83679 RepID=A0AAE0PC16_SORBR|nr:hypothetical protein B0T20DRAFT_394309 [Sordaria brevicollis]